MSQKRRKEDAKTAVLRELEQLNQDRHPRNQSLVRRFVRCGKLQEPVQILARAVEGSGRWSSGTHLTAPPGWLPPLI
jgi:hypothetical protein